MTPPALALVVPHFEAAQHEPLRRGRELMPEARPDHVSASDLSGLRRRLAGATAREAVVVDFLEDDLREAEAALGEVAGWLDAVQDALHDARAGRERLTAVAARDPLDAVDYLGETLDSLRRRVTQVASALDRASRAPRIGG